MLEQLRAAGATLALDDFGTGYSSLAYLQRFPFDIIKVDRGLIREAGGGGGSATVIVRSIVALAEELDKKVVAEGIETPEDASFLRSIGCEYGQGYYYGEPVSDREVIDLLRLVKKTDRNVERRWGFGANAKRNRKSEVKPESKSETPAMVAAPAAVAAAAAPSNAPPASETAAPAQPAKRGAKRVPRRERPGTVNTNQAPPAAASHQPGPPAPSIPAPYPAPNGAPPGMPHPHPMPPPQATAAVNGHAPAGPQRLSAALANLPPAGPSNPGQPVDMLARMLQSASQAAAKLDAAPDRAVAAADAGHGSTAPAAASSMNAIAAALAPPGQRRR